MIMIMNNDDINDNDNGDRNHNVDNQSLSINHHCTPASTSHANANTVR